MFEKKRGTRFLASVMALVMLLSLAPVGALAAGGGGYGISVNLNETNRGECNVYYAETKTAYRDISTDQSLTELNQGGSVTHAKSEDLTSYGVIFFVAPHNGYALEGLDATASAGIYQSIVNNENPRQTDFWTKNSQIENLTSAGFTEEQIEALVQAAKDRGCVAAFIFTRSASNWGDINSNLNFTTHQLATFEKSITAVQRGDETYTENLDTVKVRVGDVITYSFKVTFYPGGNNITYSDIVVTDERLGGEDSRITFADSSSAGTQTETKNYTVTSEDIRTGKLENTATLTYKYKAPYNVGAVNSTATATAKIATVSAVSYQYDDGPRPSDATDVTTGVYAPTERSEGESVTVAANPTGTGYTFSGWTAPDDVTVNDNGTFTMPDKSITFTGKWIANTHSVTYKDETATISSLSQDNVAYGTTVAVPSYSKDGYTLTGWKSDADNNTYSPNQTFTMPDKDVTLTAQWKETNPAPDPDPDPTPDSPQLVTAQFYINLGGKDASKPDGSGLFTRPAIVINEAINLDVFTTHATRGYGNNGYIFNKDGVKKLHSNLLTEEPTSEQINEKINTNLPADKQNSMTVGGDTGREVVWYHVSDCTNMRDGYHVDGYIKNAAIKITYNPNGGIFAGEETSKNHVVDGKSGEVHQIIQDTPARDGYIFNGWKLEGSENIYQPNGSITPTGDVTLVAQWRVTLTYHENFGNTEHTYTISFDEGSTQTVQSYAELRRLYGVFGENTGFYFDKWTTQADGKGTSYKKGNTISMTDSIDLYAQWKQARVPKVAYTINQHFMDGEGKPSVANPDITTNKTTKNAQTTLDSLITDGLKKSKTGTDGKTYVYVPSETKFTLNDKAVTALVDGTEIHLYYYLDEVGGTPEKEGADRPDGIPDAWQHKVTFQVVNGNWNVSKNNKNIVVYVNAKNQAGEVLDSKLTASQIPAVGSEPNSGYEASGSWDKTLSDGLVINADTTFTFTYSKRSSSGGSSRPSTPTVTIPDDVPTGLNGKDHYAYIIGYGNNDVRPQNNITRAEVATIFFRLLTDETREANMTKSNGYNDVKDGDWFCCAVSTLSKMGIIKGYEDGSFKPNDPISRAEFAAIAARFDPDGDKTPASFSDVTSHWAKDEISIAANHGWIKGYEDGSFKPDQKITRAETMTLVNRVLNRLPETKDDLHKDMKTWVDNMDETAWYYLAVQEATNSHYFKNKTGTKFEQWTDLRDTRDWSELEK